MRCVGVALVWVALTICSTSSFASYAPPDLPGGAMPANENTGKTAFVAGAGIEAGYWFGSLQGPHPWVFVDAGVVTHNIGLRGLFKSVLLMNQGGGEISYQFVNRPSSYMSVYGGGGVFHTDDARYKYVRLGIEYGRALRNRLKGSFLCFQLGSELAVEVAGDFDDGEDTAHLIYGSVALRHRWSSAPKGSTVEVDAPKGSAFGADRIHIRAGLGVPELAAAGLGIRLYDVWHLEARVGFVPVPDPPLSVVLEGYRMREKKGFQHGPCAAGAAVFNWDGQGYYAGGGYRIQVGRGDVRVGAEMLVYFRVAGINWGLPIMPAPAVFLVWRPAPRGLENK